MGTWSDNPYSSYYASSMSNGKKKVHRKGYLTAQLRVFDFGWADKIIYSIKGKSNEKHVGIRIIEKIKELFGISDKELHVSQMESIEKELEELGKIKWTRDEEGKIVSPYRSKKIN